jgi:hypothetical protein
MKNLKNWIPLGLLITSCASHQPTHSLNERSLASISSMTNAECKTIASKFLEANEISYAIKIINYCRELELAELNKSVMPSIPENLEAKLKSLELKLEKDKNNVNSDQEKLKHQEFLNQLDKDDREIVSSGIEVFYDKYKDACKNDILKLKLDILYKQELKFSKAKRQAINYQDEEKFEKLFKENFKKKIKGTPTDCYEHGSLVYQFGSSTTSIGYNEPGENFNMKRLIYCADQEITSIKSRIKVCEENNYLDTRYGCEEEKYPAINDFIRSCYMIENDFRSQRNPYKEIPEKFK